ncbi:hypothetical protein HGP17_03415 [Rhizobium sp. P38BS-XIX]|uniref:hypothetical protein n=1 Tax=Rhizobium sp. P38BS-XIX TaxID=2726740 RepID=UPI0014573A5A|nr:hypothetical protein [Rhizobium sp. P38BS-XIX]NLR95880.1 hypothetical protein [Rhizobium sp. P38BS-XIX]
MTDRYGPTDNADQKARKTRRFGIDPVTRKLVFGSVKIPLPQSRLARVGLGIALIIGGLLGFLPILGFWMLPLGFIVLSHDMPIVRRWRRRFAVWWMRKRRPAN